MFKYLKEYSFRDMQQVIRNGKLPPAVSEERLDGRLAIVTGATSGVGLAAARRLGEYGADLLLINRNPAKTTTLIAELRNSGLTGSIDSITADFSCLNETARAAKQVLDRGKQADILVNNAGIHMTTRELTSEGFEMVFAVNHLSPFILTRALLPGMTARGKGRIIQVNSQGHRFFGLNINDLDWQRRPYMGLRAYGAAKTAQLLCTWEFAEQISGIGESNEPDPPKSESADGLGLSINAMHPGAVRTNVGNNNGPLYRWFQKTMVQPGLDDVAISGLAIHYLASDPDLRGVSGRFFNLTTEEKPAPHALDRELGRKIWDISNEIADKYMPV